MDDCTIELRDFFYDGAGIVVQAYGALGGNYQSGFAIGPDLIKSGGYRGETITLTMPEGQTMDDLDGISIWCVAVGIDFGSGMFR